MSKDEKEIKEFIKSRYANIATGGNSCCSGGTCSTDLIEQAKAIGYSLQEIESVPEEAILGLGCGNPFSIMELKEGEIVLDLGCGAGFDVFIAASKVGDNGKVIGVDFTPEMIEKAKENAEKGNYKNVEFKIGEIENLPQRNNSIDVIISNCVVNLSHDKSTTYREAFRVLKPNGRILISDIVTEGELPDEIRQSFEAWAGCIAGAFEKQAYLRTIREAGFRKISIVDEHHFNKPGMDERLKDRIISIQVKAYK